MKTSLSLNGTVPSRPAAYSEEELKVIYAIQALLSNRIVTKSSTGRYHFRPRFRSKTIIRVLETGLTKFPELEGQLRMVLKIYRPNLLGKLKPFLAKQLRSRMDASKLAAML